MYINGIAKMIGCSWMDGYTLIGFLVFTDKPMDYYSDAYYCHGWSQSHMQQQQNVMMRNDV